MVPNQSASTSIGLTSGRESPLKNFPHSCKYSTGEALKVWFARGAIQILAVEKNISKNADRLNYANKQVLWKVAMSSLINSLTLFKDNSII